MFKKNNIIYAVPPVQGQMPNGHSIKIMISVDLEVTSSKTFIGKCIYVHPSYSQKNKKSREISLKTTEQINQVRIITHSTLPAKQRGPSYWEGRVYIQAREWKSH